MSFTLFQEWRVMLAELLLSEKDATRKWLRAEMDRLVDPMLDSIYDRLNNKLANGLERTQSGDGGDYHEKEMIQGDQLELTHDQVDQTAILNVQPSTSSHLIPPHQNVHYSYQQPNDNPIHSNDNSNQQSEIQSFVQPTMLPSAQVNFDELSNVPSGQDLHPLDASVEQSNPSLKDPNWDGEVEDDEECDCDDCVNGGIEVKKGDEDEDDNDSVQLIDDDQDEQELPCPVKKPRMDSTQPNSGQPEGVAVSQRQPTEEVQPIDHDKHFITVHLRCPELGCPETFAETELNDHLMDEHLIGPNRCLVKDCKQSFGNHQILGKHIKQSHQSITQWHCNKCSKHFSKYVLLSSHNILYHHLGQFQCSFPACTFTGEYKMKVFTHYKEHKPNLVCQQSGCYFRTNRPTRFKEHERAHLGIRPYRCKWPNCHYSNESQNTAMMHIRSTHFKSKTSSSPNLAHLGKPKDYLEIVR